MSTVSAQLPAGWTLTSITPGSGVTLSTLRRGSGGGNGLNFTTSGIAKETGQPVEAQITIEFTANGYRMVTRGTDPQTGNRFEVSNITFTRVN